jgi:winged helix DNA-binding protein
MPEPDLALDRLIHEPGRLAILTVLSSASDADFLFVQRATGLTNGNLSSHLTKLGPPGSSRSRSASSAASRTRGSR